MTQDIVNQITFTSSSAPYRLGETAGFAPDIADMYVKAGVATVTKRGVPRVSPAVAVSDTMQKLEAIGVQLNAAEREAKRVAKTPDGAAEAADILRNVADARRALDANLAALAASGVIAHSAGNRLPNAGGGAT